MAAAAIFLSALAATRPAAETEVTVSAAGFKPAELAVHKGETLRLRLRSLDREHCFAIDAFRVEKRVLPGKVTAVEVVADRTGTFAIHSCLEPANATLRGRLIVSE
jgi:heme/copper-type cytochrome/quinol oxidase subunit 2